MKRILTILLAFGILLALPACGAASTPASWQEEYDLGVKYLEDGNYQEAVLSFTAAIEIEPNHPEAYLSLSDAYMGLGDTDAAKQALEDGLTACGEQEALREKLNALSRGASDADAKLLEALIPYFTAGEQEALAGLVRDESYEKLSAAATEVGIYTGETTDGATGVGIAVYPDNRYYYGDWADGHRAGNGKWLSVWDDSSEMYDGAWSADKPNGDGTITKLSEPGDLQAGQTTSVKTVVEGAFLDGLYNGQIHEMWSMNDGTVHDWSLITAANGIYQPIEVPADIASRGYVGEYSSDGQFLVALTDGGKTDLWDSGSVHAVAGFQP